MSTLKNNHQAVKTQLGGGGGGGGEIKNVNLKVKLKVCFSDTHKCHYSLAQEQA